jgi:predicted nucleic acid-binding protein
MTIHLDTSALVDALTGPRRSIDTLIALIDEGHRPVLSSLALYEWLRGPRTRPELAAPDALSPRAAAVPFGPEQAALAEKLYASVPRPRGREIDLALAACALVDGAAFWTLNRNDFRDVPGLSLI